MDVIMPREETNAPVASSSKDDYFSDSYEESVLPQVQFPPLHRSHSKKATKKLSKKSKQSKGASKKLKKSKKIKQMKRGPKLERNTPSPTKSPATIWSTAPSNDDLDKELGTPTRSPSFRIEILPTISPAIQFLSILDPPSALAARTSSPSHFSQTSASPSSLSLSFESTTAPSIMFDPASIPPIVTIDITLQPLVPSLSSPTLLPKLTNAPSLNLETASPSSGEETQIPFLSLYDTSIPTPASTMTGSASALPVQTRAPSFSPDAASNPLIDSPTSRVGTLGPISMPSEQRPGATELPVLLADTLNPTLIPSPETTTPSLSSDKTEPPFLAASPTLTPSSDEETVLPSGQPSIEIKTKALTTRPSSSPSFTSMTPTAYITVNPTDEPTAFRTETPTSSRTLAPSSAAKMNTVDAETENDGFTTTLDLTDVPAKFQSAFIKAAATWDSIITGDLEDYPIFDDDRTNPELICDGNSLPEVVDDVFICASLPDIDGSKGILGSAGPIYGRFGEFVQTSVGYMQFDLADIKILAAEGRLDGLILHEMAHVYGTGTLWALNGLVPETPDCPYRYDSRASEEYRTLSGCDSSVPTETDGGLGTACLHWDEKCFKSELMTGFNTGDQELSRVSIATLEDMGYVVDYNRADPFSVNQLHPDCVCNAGSAQSNKPRELFPIKSEATKTADARSLEASEQARLNAIDYGKVRLSKSTSSNYTAHKGAYQMSGRIYLADKMVVVLYFDGDEVKSVVVTPDS